MEMRGADGDLWERVRPPLGGAEGAAERDMLGVLAAPPTLTSPFSPAPTPNLGLDCTALGVAVAQQGEPFLGQVAWDGLLPLLATLGLGLQDTSRDMQVNQEQLSSTRKSPNRFKEASHSWMKEAQEAGEACWGALTQCAAIKQQMFYNLSCPKQSPLATRGYGALEKWLQNQLTMPVTETKFAKFHLL